MERLGLVGLPNAGKTSLFNALTGGSALVASHPFSTTESSVGIATVPDERLWKLAEMSQSRKVVPTGVEFIDMDEERRAQFQQFIEEGEPGA